MVAISESKRWLAVVLLGSSLVTYLATACATPQDRGRSFRVTRRGPPTRTGINWLVLIAIDRYKHQKTLKGPRRDVRALKKVLLRDYDFDERFVRELYDSNATRAHISRLFRDLVASVQPRDRVLNLLRRSRVHRRGLPHRVLDPIRRRHGYRRQAAVVPSSGSPRVHRRPRCATCPAYFRLVLFGRPHHAVRSAPRRSGPRHADGRPAVPYGDDVRRE